MERHAEQLVLLQWPGFYDGQLNRKRRECFSSNWEVVCFCARLLLQLLNIGNGDLYWRKCYAPFAADQKCMSYSGN